MQLDEATQREGQQKALYQRILRLIKEQFESNSTDSEAFLHNINNVQTIINEANKDLALSPIKARHSRRVSSISSIGNLKPKEGPPARDLFAGAPELQSKEAHEETVKQLTLDYEEKLLTLGEMVQKAAEENAKLRLTLQKLERASAEQHQRETKLKSLHADEQKYTQEMFETQN